MGIIELRDHDIFHLSDNLAAAQFFGTTPAAMQNKLASQLGFSATGEIDLWYQNYLESARTGTPIHFEYVHTINGENRRLAATVSPIITSPPGQQFCYVVEDITERKQIEEALKLSEQRLSLHFQQTPLAVIEWDLDFRVTKWNRAAERIFGYTASEAVGRHSTELILPESTRPQVDIVWHNLLTGNGGERSTNENITKDGRLILCEWYNTPLKTTGGNTIGVASLVEEITEQKKAEKVREVIFKISQAAISTATLTDLYHSIHTILGELMPVDNFYIALFDPSHGLLSFPYYVDQFDPPPPPQKLGHGLTEYVLRTARPLLISKEAFQELIQQGEVELEGANSLAWLGVPLKVEDRLIGVMVTQNYFENVRYTQSDLDMLEFVSSQVAQAIARKADEEQIRQNVIRTQGLVEISAAIFESGLDTQTILDNISRLVSKLTGDACTIGLVAERQQQFSMLSFFHPEPCQRAVIAERLLARPIHMGQGLHGSVLSTGDAVLLSEATSEETHILVQQEFQEYREFFEIHSVLIVPLRMHSRILGTISVTRDNPGHAYSEDDLVFLQEVADRAALAVTNASLYSQEQARRKELSVLYSLTSSLRQAMLVSDMLPIILREVRSLFKADCGMIALVNSAKTQFTIAQADGSISDTTGHIYPVNEGILGKILQTNQAYVFDDFNNKGLFLASKDNPTEIGPAIFIPLLSEAELQGVLMIARNSKLGTSTFSDKEAQLLVAIGEIVGNSLRRANLFEDSQRRLKQTQSLRAIDTAISSSHDLQVTLNVFLAQVVEQLKVDAVCVLLLDQEQVLNYSAGLGFRTSTLQHTRLRLGDGYAGMAVNERRIVNIPDLRNRKTDFLRSPTFSTESFVTYYAIPLATENQVTGVLEIYHRSPLNPDSEWLEFAQTLAGQAAIAIDNAKLFIELERSNLELTQAYEATIEGWSRALDLRDHETEGHTLRVTKLTVQMAQMFGLSGDVINHIHRGALLHDIGKMGIPDEILLKPGPLSPDEWEQMRKHPVFARDFLSPIAYLQPAIQIPFSHHEKWDGTGYPQGLKEDNIPLPARIFSIVDVWDALTSDRPYRSAWPKDKAFMYICCESGKHFDPNVVSVFKKLIFELKS